MAADNANSPSRPGPNLRHRRPHLRLPPAKIGGAHGTVPPSMDARYQAFSSALRKAEAPKDRCSNCGSSEHGFRDCEEPLRNEDFKTAAFRAKGLVRDTSSVEDDLETSHTSEKGKETVVLVKGVESEAKKF